ncbi:MAG: HlyD family type I secretion periplasmic adaptor subunit [Pseudomonadota bacterium]|uniref:HlyD family type I secretion periplasmic adaptor subunit n=1 Tax=Roseixanthobacter finlandensis TaxID=3119922 RepID=UPI00372C5C0D
MAISRALVPHESQPATQVLPPSNDAALRRSVSTPMLVGLWLILVFLGGFLAWAMLAPLAGGAVAPGVISPDGSRRTIQHLEGGIIAGLQVRDGAKVAAGQPLVVLESLQAETVLNSQLNQYYTLLAMQARLVTEQQDRLEIAFPGELLSDQGYRGLKTIVEGQRAMFETRRTAHQRRHEILHQRIQQFHQQINALKAQAASSVQQLTLIGEELDGKRILLSKNLIRKPEVLSLERAQAEIEGRRGEYIGMISRAEQQIGEAEVQLLALDAERADQVSEQMDKVRVELAAVMERLQSSKDILSRTVVIAPVSGTVVNLRFKTLGGVIRAGEAILDIVPDGETLLIEARVSPVDIDVVHAGLAAQVHLTAFSKRALPRMDGIVNSISADRLVDQTTGQSYYLARVEVDVKELERLKGIVELLPGMPAEVLIVTQERTFVDYLIEPFKDAMRRSFREV